MPPHVYLLQHAQWSVAKLYISPTPGAQNKIPWHAIAEFMGECRGAIDDVGADEDAFIAAYSCGPDFAGASGMETELTSGRTEETDQQLVPAMQRFWAEFRRKAAAASTPPRPVPPEPSASNCARLACDQADC